MRPYKDLAAALKAGRSISMPDGETVTDVKRLRELIGEAEEEEKAEGADGETADSEPAPRRRTRKAEGE